jgi:hypothetical protein
VNWRTAHNHRKKAARRTVEYQDWGNGIVMRVMDWSQSPRRPRRRMRTSKGEELTVGPISTRTARIAWVVP